MKGREQGACIGCGLRKGDRDRNAGWYELKPRGEVSKPMLFCPPCSGALLVGLDERMTEGKKNPNLRAVLVGDLDRIAGAVVAGDLRAVFHILEQMVPDAFVQRRPGSHLELHIRPLPTARAP